MGVTIFPGNDILPPGMLMPYAGATVPEGWLVCNGAPLAVADYPVLFAAIGYTYGGAGATFNLPNLKGRVIVGVDAAQAEFDTLGETGGFKTHVLTTAESPAHTHTLAHTHGMNSVNTRHAHNVYARNQDTGTVSSWHTHNYDHWHIASTGQVGWNGTQTHGHHGRGGISSEGPQEGFNWAGAVPVNVTGTGAGGTGNPSANHVHNFNHDHPSTNYQDESPWGGGTATNHDHTTNSQSVSTTSTGTGAGAAHNNLQPYLTMNYLIKI